MKTALTRRMALAGAVPVIAAVTLPAVAGAAVLADPQHADAALLAMEPRLRALFVAWKVACEERAATERAFSAAKPKRPRFGPAPLEKYGDLDALDAWLKDQQTRFEAYETEIARLKDKHGVATSEKGEDARHNEFLDALSDLAELPAETPAGVAFKVRWAEHEDHTEMRDAIYRDILAMAAAERAA